MSLDYPILPICQTAESFRNILSAMGPYRDSISLKKSPLLGLYTGSEAQLDLATVRYHALGAYAKSVYLVSPPRRFRKRLPAASEYQAALSNFKWPCD